MNSDVISIDGAEGTGGGQILRTAVSLGAALGKDIHVTAIRSGRPKPGLRHQHLTAVRAAAAICGGELTGDEIGSCELTFRPGTIQPGEYRFDIGTAGSCILVLQTLIPALMLTGSDSAVTVTGGTHNPFAPCFEYLRDVFGVLASAANLQAYFEMSRAGFYPAGGGEIRMEIRGVESVEHVAPLRFSSRGDLKYIEGISAISSTLGAHILERQTRQVLCQLAKASRQGRIEQVTWDTQSPGTAVFVRVVFSRTVAGFFSPGERGKPAELVADLAVLPLLEFLESPGVIDSHAADQLITIAALAPEESYFLIDRISDHLLSNAAVIRQITGRKITIEGEPGTPGKVTVEAVC